MPPADPVDAQLIAATERWFLRRGTPHLIDGYRAGDDVLTRALPALLLVFLLELLGAANLAWPWWQSVLAVAGGGVAAVALWALVNRARGRRWSQLPDSVGPVEIGLFLVVPTALPLVFGGQVGSAAASLAGNAALLGGIYLVTSYGLVPLTRWALGQTARQVGAVLELFGRALPLLLLFGFALFINTEVWQVATALDGLLFWTTVTFVVGLGLAFLLVRLPSELGRLRAQLTGDALVAACGSSPVAEVAAEVAAEPGGVASVPLSRRQQGNVLLVLLFSQAVQVLLVTVSVGAFFFVFGLIAIRPVVVATWLGDIDAGVLATWTWFGRELQVSRGLIHVSGFLAVLSGFYFTVYVITDATYREEFFTEILDQVRQSLAVRNVYLALIARTKPEAGGPASP